MAKPDAPPDPVGGDAVGSDAATAGGTGGPGGTGGMLTDNVMRFCRLLRAAGMPIGPGQTLQALEAVRTVGIGTREDLYWTLHASLITRHDQVALFDQAFHMVWRRPDFLRRAMSLFLPQIDEAEPPPPQKKDAQRRLEEAWAREGGTKEKQPPPSEDPPEIEFDAAFTASDRERLHQLDFEQMSLDELAEAKRALAHLRLPVPNVATRRFRADAAGPRIDLKRTLRRSVRQGGESIDLARRRVRRRPAPLVVLCDISGSMSRYSRMALHLLHAIHQDGDRVASFLFGTKLTNITRQLRDRDVDTALAQVADSVTDWSGGTRIGACLTDFNRVWSRRVLAQGAVVLLITDGLERESTDRLELEAARLSRSCRKLIWLNPLLRFDGYAPQAKGAQALMPHVHEFRAAHNLASLTALVQALDLGATVPRRDMARWRSLARAA